VHPVLRFAFRPPAGMKVVNTPTFVAARDDRRQMKFDFGRSADSDLRRYLQDEWTREIRLERVERVEFGGREGAMGFVRGKAGNRDVEAMFAAMDGPQDRVYRFIFISLGRITAADLQDYEDVLRDLDDLSEDEAAAIKPLVVRIMTVEPGQGIDDFTQMMAVNGFERDLFLTINGLTRGRRLQAGEKVKVIVRG
jgi:predicted Zn-dependent protease